MTEEEQSRKSRGAKANRSETVTVRLEPRLKYLAELAARKHRRTLSSFIEWAVEDSLRHVELHQGSGYDGDDSISIKDVESNPVKRLWDIDEPERFVRLAVQYPELLTHEEQKIWRMLEDSLLMSPAQRMSVSGVKTWDWETLQLQVIPTVRDKWDSFMTVWADNSAAQRQWVEKTREDVNNERVYRGKSRVVPKSPVKNDMDDDIPF